jgi:transposase
MKKNLPPKLNSEILKQLATEKLVEMIVEQARAIEQLKSRVIELEQEIEKLKISRDLDSTTSSKPPSSISSKKARKN